jgi:hypothetical protein
LHKRQRGHPAREAPLAKALCCAGALAFSNEPAMRRPAEFGDAKLIRKFGDIPEDLPAL